MGATDLLMRTVAQRWGGGHTHAHTLTDRRSSAETLTGSVNVGSFSRNCTMQYANCEERNPKVKTNITLSLEQSLQQQLRRTNSSERAFK